MPNSFNKGEWSEFYAFIKILADKKVYAADEDLQKIEDIFYPILKVLRTENGINKTYDLSEEDMVKIFQNGHEEVKTVSIDKIKNSVQSLFAEIKSASGASFEVKTSESLMPSLSCDKVKAESGKKEDIKLIIHDSVTLQNTEVGFSIKSNIGNSPTLLNSSKATNFRYKINNFTGDIEEINGISGRSKIQKRLSEIREKSSSIEFDETPHKVFKKNLRKNDSLMPLILSEFLLSYFGGDGSKVSDLTGFVAKSPRIQKLNLDFDCDDIKFKIKYLLLNIALGMVPATLWDGFLKADGGYIIVKENGDLLCYHIYNISQFSEYLFNNSRFDTPSSSRNNFGDIYEENGQHYLNLNIQIRFI